MGQKVSPIGLRVGVNKGWTSQWICDKKDIARYIAEDDAIRKFIKKNYYHCSIASIVLERTDRKLVVNIATAKPGMIIGSKGAGIETLKKQIAKISPCDNIIINVREVKRPETNAVLMAENIAAQLEKRVAWRRAIKEVLSSGMKAGAKGVKIMIGGRLNGADMARSVFYKEGSLPLHTLRSNIDYGTAEAHTTFGVIGIKVWVYKGEILGKKTTPVAPKNEEGGNN